MPKILPVLGAAALLFSPAALAQASSHHNHGNAGSAQQRPAQQTAPVRDATNQGDNRPLAASRAFQGYRPYRVDEPLVGWREANDLVLQIGGHVGIMKGAAGKEETPGAHAGHQKSKPAGAAK